MSLSFTLAAGFGAWMLYLVVGIVIALVPRPWPPAGSPRGLAASAVPLLLGAWRTARTGELAYIVAGVVATVMVSALVRKRAEDTA